MKVIHKGVDNFGRGGRSVIAYNLSQNMDELVENDFLSYKDKSELDQCCVEQIEKKGNKIIFVKVNTEGKFVSLKRLFKSSQILRNENYNVMHIHADDAHEAVKGVMIAKFAGIKNIIIHAHKSDDIENFTVYKKIKYYFWKLILSFLKFQPLACSNDAARFMFGVNKNSKKCILVKDGIDVNKFAPNLVVRNEYRKKFNISKRDLVIICVARFSQEKI